MYFLWKNTPYGLIKISCKGLVDFTNEALRSRFRLYNVSLSPSKTEHADITIVISDEDLQPKTKETVENHLTEVLKPMGMKALIVWASPERGFLPVILNPYVWSAIASCSAVIITAGFSSFFWTAFWGASAWFVFRGVSVLAQKFRRA